MGDDAAAEEAFRRAVALAPDLAEAHFNLAVLDNLAGRLGAAARGFETAVHHDPDLKEALFGLGAAWKAQGRTREAMTAFDRAIAIDPDYDAAWANLLYTAMYVPGLSPADIRAMQADFGARMAARGDGWTPPWEPRAEGPLRVGFVCGDLHRHPVATFLAPLLRHRDPAEIETVCIRTGGPEDTVTERLRGLADRWVEADGLDDAVLAGRVRAEALDVAVDLSGFTARGRPGLYAFRMAPVQAAWIGAVATTGLPTIDLFLGDSVGVRPGEEAHYSETVVRLDPGWLVYEPLDPPPPVGPLPARENGFVTFGCLNTLAKVSDEALALWAPVLAAVPDSRLRLRTRALADAETAGQVRERFAAAGGDPSRLDLLGPVRPWEVFADYNAVDIALDPRPYSGGQTTCEALWMGVPVVTWPGETFAGRHNGQPPDPGGPDRLDRFRRRRIRRPGGGAGVRPRPAGRAAGGIAGAG